MLYAPLGKAGFVIAGIFILAMSCGSKIKAELSATASEDL